MIKYWDLFLRHNIDIKSDMASHVNDVMIYLSWLVGWEINVHFQHKNMLYRRQGIEWRFSSATLRMVNDTVTPDLFAFLFSGDPKWERTGEAYLSYYASAYNIVE